jgi:ParB/RepB/Spo0J family partition protein
MSEILQNIPVNLIRAGSNDRKHFDENALHELAESIKNHGLAQPITIRPMDGGQWYEIVAGERRYRAISQILEWDTIPAIVRDLNDEEASAIMLVENTARVDLDPIAEAKAYSIRIEKFCWSVATIAGAAGVSAERVRSRLSLLKLTEDIQHYVRVKQFPIGHAELITELDNNRQRIAVRVFNSAKAMPLSRFREVVAELVKQQAEESQMDMFALELKMVEAVANDEVTALRGKKAKTGAPVNKQLPPVKVSGKDAAGDIFDRYIMELMQAGNAEAAATIGTIYNALVAGNWVQVPANSLLAKIAETDETAGDAPVVKL